MQNAVVNIYSMSNGSQSSSTLYQNLRSNESGQVTGLVLPAPDISELGYDKLTSKEIKEKLGEITFFTATDGNHGRGVAWTAN
ncbi:hypothetical protein ACTPEM_26650, partial [Clostridioides difficile]